MLRGRIKKLEGEPAVEPAEKAQKGQEIQHVFSFDAKLEDDTMDVYNQFLLVCRDNGDSTSMKLFEAIIDEEQIHFNYFDNVDTHIKNLDGTYLAQIAGTPSATGLQTQGFVARQAGGGTPAA